MVITLPTKRYVAQRKQEQEWAEEKLEAEINEVMTIIDIIEDNFYTSAMFVDQTDALTEFRKNLLNIIEKRCYNADRSVKQEYIEKVKAKYNDDYMFNLEFSD